METRKRLTKYLEIPRYKNLYEATRNAFDRKDLIAHSWDHIYRDIINALVIGENEKADMDIVFPAIVLHDIGFLYDPNPAVHHTLGSEKCHLWLDDWNEEERSKIAQCILVHKGKMRQFTYEPSSLEEKVVCDADMLEKVGWLGVAQGARTFVEFAEKGMRKYKALSEIAKTISETKHVTFYTEMGKKIAEERGGYKRAEVFEKILRELTFYET